MRFAAVFSKPVSTGAQVLLQQLTERQQSALRDMAHHWLATNRGVDLVHLTHALCWERNRAKEVLDALLKKQFIKFESERPARGGGAGKPSKLYRPVDAVLPFFSLVPDQSDKSDPMSDPISPVSSSRKVLWLPLGAGPE